jgi:hypothetical protein
MLVSTRKRYLSGSDWVISTLDRMMKNATSAGNMSQVVLQLGSSLDEEEIGTSLKGFLKRFPVLQGRVSRDIKLAPYWKIPAKAERDVTLAVQRVDDAACSSILPYLEKSANTPFRDDSDHLAFHFIADGKRSVLSMRFDHRIFDARGAELFLNLFQQGLNDGLNGLSGNIAFSSSSALSQWSKKFLAGRNVNRRIMAFSKAATPEALPLPEGGARSYRYRLLSFSEQETAEIYERAYREAGYLLESPYLLAVIIQGMHELFRNRDGSGSSYLIPVTMDLRPGRDPL